MKNLTWQNPEQLFVAQELINKVKSKCCGIKDKVKFVITTERDIASICEAFDTKAFVIAAGEQMKLDGFVMHDSNEMVNYINSLLY